MPMYHKRFLIIAVLAAATLAACKDDAAFIPAGEMEDILYDYHLADAMAAQAQGGYEKNAIAYRAAVLRQHGVTQARFDTSMVYYMRHTDELHTIYQHISDRMEEEARSLGAEVAGNASAAGDSANVWNGEKAIVLLPDQPYNLYSFRLKTDTTFHKGDKLLLNFQSDFIFQDGMRDGIAVLAAVLSNDSVVQRTAHLSSSTPMMVQIDDNDSIGIKEIKGFFMLSKNSDPNASATTLQLMSIHGIQLIRVHPAKAKAATVPPPVPDRIPVNKAMPDSERMKPDIKTIEAQSTPQTVTPTK